MGKLKKGEKSPFFSKKINSAIAELRDGDD
jgi:hypothetical protein